MEADVGTHREQTKVINIGDRKIGGGNPILIQSMTNTPTEDAVSFSHLRAHETVLDTVCRLLVEKKTHAYVTCT